MNNTQALPSIESKNPDPDLIPADPVIEGVEKLDDWLEHREIVVQELCPVGALEFLYAERAALYLRRIDRVTRSEIVAKIGEIEAGSTSSCEDPVNAQDPRVFPDSKSLQSIIKYEAHLLRCLASTMAELRRLQKERRQGLRDVNPVGRGADRAGVCQKEFDTKGSHGGSPSRQITCPDVSIPGRRGADRAGASKKELIEKGSHGGSPSRQITCPDVTIPGGRGADRAGVCQNQQIKDGSPGGSPSQTGSPVQNGSQPQRSSPNRTITGAEMSILERRGADRACDCEHQQIKDGSPGGSPSQTGSLSQAGSTIHLISTPEMSIPGGRGDDRAGVSEHQQIKDGSPGGSPSQKSSPTQAGSPSLQITNTEMLNPGGRGADRACDCEHQQIKDGSPGGSPSQTGSPSRKSSTSQKSSTAKKNSTTRSLSHSQRASPIPKPPPLLASITNRRRLEEYTYREIFELKSTSATLDFEMIPHS